MKNRLFALILCGLLTAQLAACGGSSYTGTDTTASSGGRKECASPVRTAESTYPASQSSAVTVPATTGTPFEVGGR